MSELNQVAVEAFKEALPLEPIVEAFKEGFAIFFSPFSGFWRAVAATRRQTTFHQLRA